MAKTLVLSKQEEKDLNERGEVTLSRNGSNYRVIINLDGTYTIKGICDYNKVVLTGVDTKQLILTGEQSKELMENGLVVLEKYGKIISVSLRDGQYTISVQNPFTNVLTYSDTH